MQDGATIIHGGPAVLGRLVAGLALAVFTAAQLVTNGSVDVPLGRFAVARLCSSRLAVLWPLLWRWDPIMRLVRVLDWDVDERDRDRIVPVAALRPVRRLAHVDVRSCGRSPTRLALLRVAPLVAEFS